MSVTGVGLVQNQQPYQQSWPTFQGADTDDDGSLSLQEFSAAGQNMPGGIGSLDNSNSKNLFSAIDADGNGKISRGEAASAFNKLSSALQGQVLGAQEQTGTPAASSRFAAADTDGSGELSLDEFEAAATKNAPAGATAPTDDQLQAAFNRLDTDGDGQISQNEMKAAHHGHHHHAHGGPAPDQTPNSDSIFGPDPFSTSPSSSDGRASAASDPSAADASGSVQLPSDLNSLLLQAMSAYNNNPGEASSNDLVNQLVDVLKAV